MSNFLQRLHSASREKAPRTMVMAIFFLASGALLGYRKAHYQAELADNYHCDPKLKSYISEDQVNAEIDRSGRPAVLYYYQPGTLYHYVLRNGFLKCSGRCHQADFYAVNLTEKLLQASDEIQHKFPFADYFIEIRFPKQNCEVKMTNGQTEEKMAYRRQFFSHQYRKEGGVQDFLQENGITNPNDPLTNIFALNNSCLYDASPQ